MVQVTLDPGQLTARLVLMAPVDVSDGQGGIIRSWQEVAWLWGALRPLSHKFDELAGAANAEKHFDIWMLMRGDIVAGMRLCKEMRCFSVLSTRDADESNRFLICRCREEA